MKRNFTPGTEWLYLKIYTGIKTSDLILEEIVQPLAEYFDENNYISKWFFIRYNDPKPHLRLRFHLYNIKFYSKVLSKINDSLVEFLQSGEISNVVTDTYRREIERYGRRTIENAEVLFWKNSEFTLQCLSYDDEEKIIFSLFYIDQTLDQLKFSVLEKINWVTNFNRAFKNEFNADKKLNSQLDKKYRAFKPNYKIFIHSDIFLTERQTIISHIEDNIPICKNIIDQSQSLEISSESFFQSVFHMNINRLFNSNQRLFEMIIYDYLNRYYKAELHSYKVVKRLSEKI